MEISSARLIFFVVLQVATLCILMGVLRHLRRMRRERNALLQEKDVVFNFVHDVGDVFGGTESVDLGGLLKRVLFYALRTTKAGAGALYLVEPDGESLRACATSGVFPPLDVEVGPEMERAFSKIRYAETLVRTHLVPMGEGLVGEVAAKDAPILIPDAEMDSRVPRFGIDFFQIHSILLVPMRFHKEVLGVLVVINRVDGQPFIQSDQNLLQALADQASVSVHYAKFSVALDEKRRLDYDLTVARRIQNALLPKSIPEIPGIELAAFSVPAQQIGGDYYDFVQIDDEHWGIAIADVSGKGIAAALVMSVCRSLLRVESSGCRSPAAVLKTINKMVVGDLSEDMFISMLYMILNTRTRELAVARGGHCEPIVCPGNGSAPWALDSRGMALGMADGETFDAVIEEKRLVLAPGDMVVAYTDGVTEAQDLQQDEWGVLNLVKAIQITALEGGGAAQVASDVEQKLIQYTGENPQYDDMTLVALKLAQGM